MKKGFTLRGKRLNLIMLVVGITTLSIVGTKAATTIQSSMVTYNNTTVKKTLDDLVDITVQGNATEEDIAVGKTAVVQGKLVTGIKDQGNLQLIYADFAQSNSNNPNLSMSWNHSVESPSKLYIHAVCVFDANNASNTIVATKNGVTLTPVKNLEATNYSQPLTHIYEVDVETGDEIEVTSTAAPIWLGENQQANRSYLAISVYST